MITKPYPHQKEGALLIEAFNGRALLADQMGLGKTVTSLLWAHRNVEARPLVVVCPAGLKWNWEREMLSHFGWVPEVLSSTKVPRGWSKKRKRPLVVVNYEILKEWLPSLLEIGPKLVILDECQRISNRTTRTYKAVKQLVKDVPYLIALSGTPFTNRPSELWPVLNLLRKDLYPDFWSYAERHCQPRKKPWGWDFSGSARLKELHCNLKRSLMIRRLKHEVLKDLPPIRRFVVPLDMDGMKEYQKAESDFVEWIKRNRSGRMDKAARAEGLARTTGLLSMTGKAKLPEVMEWVDRFLENSEGKILLSAVHRETVEALAERWDKISVMVYGGTPQNVRKAAVDSFQKNPKTRVFVGNVRAAGVGLTLTAGNTVAFAEMGWTPAEHAQMEARCNRIGTTITTDCYYLVARGTIEERMARMIQEKQKVSDSILDGRDGKILTLYDLLQEELAGEQ